MEAAVRQRCVRLAWLMGGMIRASGICSTAERDLMPARCVAWRWASLKYAGTVMTAYVPFTTGKTSNCG